MGTPASAHVTASGAAKGGYATMPAHPAPFLDLTATGTGTDPHDHDTGSAGAARPDTHGGAALAVAVAALVIAIAGLLVALLGRLRRG